MKEKLKIIKAVREGYARVAKAESSCCSSGCSCGSKGSAGQISKGVGYSDQDINSVPDGANLGLGCGNPVALASIKSGETVLDLGSGAGFDCFLASPKVGANGRVIGVDMTPEMLEKARANAQKGGYSNVEFRLGEIEHLPVADNSVDLIISNCVVNLSTDKLQVFNEALRVLKPGGRVMVSDIVLVRPLPGIVKESVQAYIGCLAGAVLKDEYLGFIEKAGFKDISIVSESYFPIDDYAHDVTAKPVIDALGGNIDEIAGLGKTVLSVKVRAVKA